MDQFTVVALALAAETNKWLQTRREEASPELAEAWTSIMMAQFISKGAMPDALESEVGDVGWQLLEDFGGRIEESHLDEYDRAMGQALNHLNTDVMMMKKMAMKHGGGSGPDDGPDKA